MPPERQTVGEFLNIWLRDTAKQSVRPATYTSYATIVRRHLLPALGTTSLMKLTPQQVQMLMNRKLQEGLSARRVDYIRGVLRSALAQAMKWGLVSRNVATLVTPPRAERAEVRPFDPEEARRFLDAIRGDRLEALYSVALAVGLRQGEALGLRWEDVELERGRLMVRYGLQRIEGNFRLVEPKTRLSRRAIDLPPTVVASLRAHRRRQLEEELASTDWRNEWGLVFTTDRGRPLDASSVTHRFQKALERAGLRRQRFHDLRHACASLLLAQGVPARVVMELLGHSQITLTLNTYSHVMPSLRREAADRMEDLLTHGGSRGLPRVAPSVAPSHHSEADEEVSGETISNSQSSTRYRTRTCDQGIKSTSVKRSLASRDERARSRQGRKRVPSDRR